MICRKRQTMGKYKLTFWGGNIFRLILSMVLFFVIPFLVAGCAAPLSKNAGQTEEAPALEGMSVADSEEISGSRADVGEYELLDENSPETREVGKRYIIHNARLTLEVEELETVSSQIQLMAEQSGGYVASLEFYDLTQEKRAGHISLRIPGDKFRDVFAQVKELGRAKNEHIYTDDVTMSYLDLEARQHNLTVQEQRLRDLLDKAGNVGEILEIEKELGRIRGDLEAMTAEFKHLQERIRFSTLDLNLQEKDPRSQAIAGDFGNFGARIGQMLALNTNRLLRGFSHFLILAIGSLPLLIPAVALVFAGWKINQVLKRKQNHEQNKGGA
jgi:hypothetical protein